MDQADGDGDPMEATGRDHKAHAVEQGALSGRQPRRRSQVFSKSGLSGRTCAWSSFSALVCAAAAFVNRVMARARDTGLEFLSKRCAIERAGRTDRNDLGAGRALAPFGVQR